MIRLVVLGSGGAVPSPERNLTSIAMRYCGNVYLFDCAEGTQRQMMKYGISYAKVRMIFLTHLHGDHIFGIPGLVRTLMMIERKEKLEIYGPIGTRRRITNLIGGESDIVEIYEISPGFEIELEGKDGAVIRAFKTEHTNNSLGYVFEEREKRRFDKEKCKELGVRGRMFRILEEKGEVEKNGRKIRIEEVTYIKPGRKIVYTGDTMFCSEVVKNSKNADILFHEATFMESEREDANEDKHSTVLDAARVAKEANVKKLVLIHISNRYKNPRKMEEEGKTIFENLKVAEDGDEFLL